MASNPSKKKKVVVTTKPTNEAPKEATKAAFRERGSQKEEMLFNRSNYMWIGIGVLCIVIGMFLMAGGKQAPDAWNESELYGFRRTVLAPIVILAGLGIQFFAIFKRSDA